MLRGRFGWTYLFKYIYSDLISLNLWLGKINLRCGSGDDDKYLIDNWFSSWQYLVVLIPFWCSV